MFIATLRNVLGWTAIPKALPLTTVKSDPRSVSICCHYPGLQLIHLPRPDFAFLPIYSVFTITVLLGGNVEWIFLMDTDT